MSHTSPQLYVTYRYVGRLGNHYDQDYASAVLDMAAPATIEEVEQLETALRQQALSQHGLEQVATSILFFHELKAKENQ